MLKVTSGVQLERLLKFFIQKKWQRKTLITEMCESCVGLGVGVGMGDALQW